MAAAKQSKPLTIDDLISAQQSIASSSTDESDIKKAEEQIARLMKLKGDSTHVTLGDVKTEIKGLREDLKKNAKGKAPAENRKPLLSLVDSEPKPASAGAPGTDTADKPESRDARKERFLNLGEKIDQRTEASRGGARNETLTSKNKGTYERFVAESGKKNEFMADATAKQTEIFQRIEDTLTQLRGAGSEDSAKLREELDKIANELHDTEDTTAKGKVSGILQNARQNAATGTRGNQGSLGDAFAALRGKKDVLKEGFSFDSRTGTARNDKTGLTAGPEAKMGRLAGAASIFGNFIGNKVEESVESKRSPGLQKFLGNFKETELPEVTGAGAEHKIGTDQPTAKSAGSAIKGATDQMSVSTLNVTAKVVNISDGKPYAGAGGAKPTNRSGPKAVTTPKEAAAAAAPRGKVSAVPAEPAAAPVAAPAAQAVPASAATPAPAVAPATAAAAPAEEGGGILGTVADVATSGGGGMLNKAGSILKGAGPGLLKGGVAALGGAALSYGGDKLKEAGYEKTGAAADIAGQAAQWGGTGAMIGSVVPGVGTAIGAGVGAVAGGAYGLYKNWGSLFGGKKEEGQAAASGASARPMSQAAAKDNGGELGDRIEAQAFGGLTKQQYEETVGKRNGKYKTELKDENGKEITDEQARIEYVKKGRDMANAQMSASFANNPTPTATSVSNGNQSAEKIGTLSAENTAARQTSNKPIVITQPAAPAPAPAQQTTMVPRGNVRPQESALESYNRRSANF